MWQRPFVKGNSTIQLLLAPGGAINSRVQPANLQSNSFPSPFAKDSNWGKDFQNYTGRNPKFICSTASDSDIKMFVTRCFIFFWNWLTRKYYKIKLQYYHKLQIKLFLFGCLYLICLLRFVCLVKWIQKTIHLKWKLHRVHSWLVTIIYPLSGTSYEPTQLYLKWLHLFSPPWHSVHAEPVGLQSWADVKLQCLVKIHRGFLIYTDTSRAPRTYQTVTLLPWGTIWVLSNKMNLVLCLTLISFLIQYFSLCFFKQHHLECMAGLHWKNTG